MSKISYSRWDARRGVNRLGFFPLDCGHVTAAKKIEKCAVQKMTQG